MDRILYKKKSPRTTTPNIAVDSVRKMMVKDWCEPPKPLWEGLGNHTTIATEKGNVNRDATIVGQERKIVRIRRRFHGPDIFAS